MHTHTHTHKNTERERESLEEGGWDRRRRCSVGPVRRTAVAGLAALSLLLHAAGLVALTGTALQGETNPLQHTQRAFSSPGLVLLGTALLANLTFNRSID